MTTTSKDYFEASRSHCLRQSSHMTQAKLQCHHRLSNSFLKFLNKVTIDDLRPDDYCPNIPTCAKRLLADVERPVSRICGADCTSSQLDRLSRREKNESRMWRKRVSKKTRRKWCRSGGTRRGGDRRRGKKPARRKKDKIK